MIKRQLSFWDKARVVFIKDNTSLNPKFKKDAEFEVYMEQEKNYIIYLDNMFYGQLKESCRKVSY
ncbi:hypothetical protein [Clostridium sp. HBUAS56017]|uniref:hypothetical protein n=1 Tax=Clostridium sp. HBUAS56017 TaxID=2571128 RepID=UPI00117801AF|nr:hypothetical protein [Clostridium sp. HBUAS56017]